MRALRSLRPTAQTPSRLVDNRFHAGYVSASCVHPGRLQGRSAQGRGKIRRKFPLGAVRTTRGCVVPAARFLSVLTWVAIASAGLAAVQETPGRLLEPRGTLLPEAATAPLLVTRLPAQQRASGVPAPARAPQRAFLDRYCTRCHGGRRQVAGLALDSVDLDNVRANAELWERVVRRLRVGVMPPFGQPRPDAAARDAFVSWAEDAMDRAAAAAPNVSRPFIHRLNRLEYTNAVRDLLALEIDGRSLLPADESATGSTTSRMSSRSGRPCWNATSWPQRKSAVSPLVPPAIAATEPTTYRWRCRRTAA